MPTQAPIAGELPLVVKMQMRAYTLWAARASLLGSGGEAWPVDVEEFCRMVYPRLARSLASYCGDAALGAEFAQEALARAWERWERVSQTDVPAMWVYRTGLNLARSHARRRATEHRALAKASATASVATEPEHAWTDSITVRQAIVRLPARQRAAIVLRYHADLSVDDTAAVMRCAPGTVKALTHQALERLRAELGADDPAAHA